MLSDRWTVKRKRPSRHVCANELCHYNSITSLWWPHANALKDWICHLKRWYTLLMNNHHGETDSINILCDRSPTPKSKITMIRFVWLYNKPRTLSSLWLISEHVVAVEQILRLKEWQVNRATQRSFTACWKLDSFHIWNFNNLTLMFHIAEKVNRFVKLIRIAGWPVIRYQWVWCFKKVVLGPLRFNGFAGGSWSCIMT